MVDGLVSLLLGIGLLVTIVMRVRRHDIPWRRAASVVTALTVRASLSRPCDRSQRAYPNRVRQRSHGRPARKAHPALLVQDLSALVRKLRAAGIEVIEGDPSAGYAQVYVADPFGNRIELMEPA